MITKTHIKDIQARVKRGAKWLDKREPGWERKVSPETLDMSLGSSCLLGQVYDDIADKGGRDWVNGYDVGTDLLEEDKQEFPERYGNLASYYGFDEGSVEDEESDMNHFWSVLAEEWVAAAKERLARGNLG